MCADTQAQSKVILSVNGLTKRFGGLTALDGVTLSIRSGTITGLVGPNGSGKTTLFNVVSGVLRPDGGAVHLDGVDISRWTVEKIAQAGIARTFQHMRLFRSMTAVENVVVAVTGRGGRSLLERILYTPMEARARHEAVREARELLERVGLSGTERQDRVSKELSFLDEHCVQIARSLALRPRVLLLDEPFTGMVRSEVESLQTLFAELALSGMAIWLIDHHMTAVRSLCPEIAVMNFGQVIAAGEADTVMRNPSVVEAYLGGSNT